jgi:hypothetical protein
LESRLESATQAYREPSQQVDGLTSKLEGGTIKTVASISAILLLT